MRTRKKAEETKKKEEEDKKKKAKKEAPKKPIITTIKEPLKVDVEVQDLPLLGEDQKKESGVKLKAWADHDQALAERATAFNDLESYVIDIEAKLWEEVYEACSTEEEREKIRAKCSEVSDWLYDEYTDETELDVLRNKLKEVKDLTSGLKARVREQHDRPEAMEALKNMVNTSQTFYGKAVNSTSVVDGYFTQDELDGLGKLLNETTKWIDDAEKKMLEEPKHQMPTVTAGTIAMKGISLDREVKYLVNKARIGKSKADAEAAAKAAKEKADAEKAKKKKAKEEAKKAKAANATETDDATEKSSDGEEKAETKTEEDAAATETEESTQEEEVKTETTDETVEDPSSNPEDDKKDEL